MTDGTPLVATSRKKLNMIAPAQTYPIGHKFTPRGKIPRVCTIIDIHRTYNAVNDLVRLRYVATHLFGGQVVTDYDVNAVTVARGTPTPTA